MNFSLLIHNQNQRRLPHFKIIESLEPSSHDMKCPTFDGISPERIANISFQLKFPSYFSTFELNRGVEALFMIDIAFAFHQGILFCFCSRSRYMISGACAFSKPLNVSQKMKGRFSLRKKAKQERRKISEKRTQTSEIGENILFRCECDDGKSPTSNTVASPLGPPPPPPLPHTFHVNVITGCQSVEHDDNEAEKENLCEKKRTTVMRKNGMPRHEWHGISLRDTESPV